MRCFTSKRHLRLRFIHCLAFNSKEATILILTWSCSRNGAKVYPVWKYELIPESYTPGEIQIAGHVLEQNLRAVASKLGHRQLIEGIPQSVLIIHVVVEQG